MRTAQNNHRSHRGMQGVPHRALLLASVLLLAAGTSRGDPPPAGNPLPEAAVFDNVDGRIVHIDANDAWLFELTADVNTADFQVAAGRRFRLLPSVLLEILIADANDRHQPVYRLSARVTRYRERNYLLPIYYLPLSRFKDSQPPPEPPPEPPVAAPAEGGTQPPGDELVIPEEILEKLRTSRPIRGALRRAPEGTAARPRAVLNRILVDCVGVIEGEAGRPRFVPYGLGWEVSDVRYELLPCSVLEQAQRELAGRLEPIRFDVAGIVTEFKEKKYLLLQRAVPVYNYGNFR